MSPALNTAREGAGMEEEEEEGMTSPGPRVPGDPPSAAYSGVSGLFFLNWLKIRGFQDWISVPTELIQSVQPNQESTSF